MTEQKGKGYQGIRATEAFDYENTRKYFKYGYYLKKWKTMSNTRLDFKYCFYWKKWKTMSDSRDTGDPGGNSK